MGMKPKFFKSSADFREWLEKNHATETELMVGFYKVGSGKGGLTYKQALDEALCYGWIDGVRRGRDESSYEQRFTPRKAKSYWSQINIARVGELQRDGLMMPAGLAAFARRHEGARSPYSYETAAVPLSAEFLSKLQANRTAAAFWDEQPATYRRTITHWVMSAKREETRAFRFDRLLSETAKGRRLGPLSTNDSYTPAPRRRTSARRDQ
jgi:uncharacterized protein YdeI (YjbR/CyaY-like superfamily)